MAVALGALLAGTVIAGEATSPEWVAKLPANKWTLIDEKQSGNRIGARVVWLEKEKKLFISGGQHSASHREPKRPGSMIFDPASGKWDEYKNEPALPPAAPVLRIRDAAKRLNVAVTLPEELKELAGEKVPANSPLEGTSKILGHEHLFGATVFLDPVNREVHLVGGSAPGMAAGSAGNWIYSVEKNEWRRSEFGSKELRELRAVVEAAGRTQKDVVAAARNIFYATMPAAEEAKAVKEKLLTAQAAALKAVAEASDRIEKEGAKAGVAAESLAAAVKLAKEALAKSQAASDGFAAGKLDAALLASAEDASWRLDEASAAMAPEPTPRRYACGMYDPERKAFVLYGGDHGDYMLGDTWLYDCAKKTWRQVWAKVSPGHRYGAQMFWLAGAKKVAMLAGSTYLSRMVYQRFDEGLAPEVWTFDPEAASWELLVRPGPEIEKKSSDGMAIFRVNNPVVLVEGGVLLCPAVGGNSYHDYMVSSTWMVRLDPAASDPAASAKAGTVGGQRLYRSQKVEAYNPQWYDAAPRGNTAEIDKLIAQMPANQWVEVPTAPRPCPERSWGTSVYDPDHDQIFAWSGGHCADPADIVHHYHPGVNRWSLPYVAGGGALGNQLTGRPDCNNHTYHNFAFDPVSRKMVATQRSGTHVYDPEKREWVGFTPEQLFPYNSYSGKCVGTPKGVVAWAGGCNDGGPGPIYFQLFDVKAMKWTPLPVKGKVPRNVHGDEGGMAWDSKRGILYIYAAGDYQKPDGHVHRYDPATGEMTVVDPAGRAAIGDKFHTYRETVYLPELDLVLFGMGWVGGRQVVYDPEKSRWAVLNITKTSAKASYDAAKGSWSFAAPKADGAVGSITFSPVLDTRRNVLWAPSDYKAMYVLKFDPKTLVVSEDPAK
ncbi:MAG TPA: kelch repeat-containing protein [Planctomycetota bacterium]|nr:kelch repeat-containing protein [Planctomycetota bacterium]